LHLCVCAVIIAARGVTLASSFLSGLLETDGIVLHCDERYQPCGWTTPGARVVDLKTFQHQTAQPKKLNERLRALRPPHTKTCRYSAPPCPEIFLMSIIHS
jgi:hypothetical protein